MYLHGIHLDKNGSIHDGTTKIKNDQMKSGVG